MLGIPGVVGGRRDRRGPAVGDDGDQPGRGVPRRLDGRRDGSGGRPVDVPAPARARPARDHSSRWRASSTTGRGSSCSPLALDLLAGHGSLGGALVSFVVVVVGSSLLGAALGWAAVRLVGRVDEHVVELTITIVLAYGTYLARGDPRRVRRDRDPGRGGRVRCRRARRADGPLARGDRRRLGARRVPADRERLPPRRRVDRAGHAGPRSRADRLGRRGDARRPRGGRLRPPRRRVAARPRRAEVGRRGRPAGGETPRLGLGPVPIGWLHVLFWAGLRGAVSVALALSLPRDLPNRELLQGITFGIVLFTLLVQGTTVNGVVRRSGALATDPRRGSAGGRDARSAQRRNSPRRCRAPSSRSGAGRPCGGARRSRRGTAARSASGPATRCSRRRAGRSRRATSPRTARSRGRVPGRIARRRAGGAVARRARASATGRSRRPGSSGRSTNRTRPSPVAAAAGPAVAPAAGGCPVGRRRGRRAGAVGPAVLGAAGRPPPRAGRSAARDRLRRGWPDRAAAPRRR